ncbi:uncharacterized protein LOC121386121 [Gigantopelta aegis]|uniref:uncharacterized protein LOC121386121 n=1 Tax=Gigantopelta aegis TaxID=1735272 RepID=UPI001B889EE8|nr:uncharacterized protein LOC121386121 [Gigantopelta aegis]
MDSLKELMEQGELLGYEGESLREFVREQQAQQREERVAQREKEREEREYKLALEKEREEREYKLALEKLELEIKAKQIDHEHQLELLQKQAELSGKGNVVFQNVPKGPKIPAFEDGKDDMDSYLRRFERYAEVQKWPTEMWATHLSALSKGRALDVYASMPSEQALNYNNLKEALLKRYDLTEDGFRLKFRTGKPETGETFQQFSVRLASYLRRWLEMSKTEHTFKALFDVIMRDQFVQICNRELALFLKERTPTTIDEMAVLADQFREARFTRAVNLTKGLGIQFSQNIPERKSKEGNGTTKISKPNVSGSFSNKRCFRYGKLGHIATHCYQKVQQSKVGCMTSERELVSRERSAGEIGIRTEQGMKDNGYKNAGTIPKVCGTCVSYTTTVTTASTSSECILSTSCDLKN